MFSFAKKPKERSRGFTLIELLVVISIISLLTSVVLAFLASARAKARDTKLISGATQLQIALELFRNDNGYYPGEDLSPSYFDYANYVDSSGVLQNQSKITAGPPVNPPAPELNLPVRLAPYLPIMPHSEVPVTNYLEYNHDANALSNAYNTCSNQNGKPRYIIIFKLETTTNLPTVRLGDGSTIPGFGCLSGPQ